MKKHLLLVKVIALLYLFVGWTNGFGQIISQYIETSSGSTPKGIEIWNNTSSTLDFSSDNLSIFKGTNGGSPSEDITISTGTLAPGEVWIIGTSDIGTYLTNEGIGTANYTSYSFTFNGDDALEVYFGGTKTDVFGDPGTGDPGTGWSGNGVQTYNQNISLLSGIADGDIDGWTDPSERFETTSTDNSLTGFGIAPVAVTDTDAPVATFIPEDGSSKHNINNEIVITFDEGIFAAADGSAFDNTTIDNIVTLKLTNDSGSDVAFDVVIDGNVVTVTPSSALTDAQLYYLAVAGFEDAAGNETAGQSITFTATNKAITITAPTGGETFNSNETTTVTWTSSNVSNVDILLYIPSSDSWSLLKNGISDDGSEDITIPVDAGYSTDYKIQVVDDADANIEATSDLFTVIPLADNIADLKTFTDGDIVKLNSEAVITYMNSNRNQKFIQDASAAILIDDNSGTISTSYNRYDGITGLLGKLGTYNGLRQFVPQADPGAATSNNNVVTPQEITIDEFNTNYTDYESELIKFVNVNFNGEDGTGDFAAYTNYTVGDGTNTTTFRLGFTNLDYIDNIIPHESIDVTLVGIGSRYNTTPQFYSREAADMTIPNYIVITSPADDQTFDTDTDVSIDFSTFGVSENLKLQVYSGTWEDHVTDIDYTTGTTTAHVPAEGIHGGGYKMRLANSDASLTSNEVPFSINDMTVAVHDDTPYAPANADTDVDKSTKLTINFKEMVALGTGNAVIYNYDTEEIIETIDITNASLTNGYMSVEITPAELPNLTKVYVLVDQDAIVDGEGNNDFQITSKDTWAFTTLDNIAPVAIFDPADTDIDIARNKVITITYDEAIRQTNDAAFDNTSIDNIITFKLTDENGADVAFDATIDDNKKVISITPDAILNGLTTYYLAVSADLEDASDNAPVATAITFTTADASIPVVSTSPEDNDLDVARDANIVITFDQAVRNTDDSAVENSDLAAMITLKEVDENGNDIAFTATINAGKTEITIVPDADLANASAVYVKLDGTVLESDQDKLVPETVFTFTTADTEAPVAGFDPANSESDVAINASIIITFDEAIANTDASVIDDTNVGDIITLKKTDAAGDAIAFAATIDANKKVITVTPDADLAFFQAIYVAVAAVEDAAGNESAIQTATFTTVKNSDATLSNLQYDATSVSNFDAATLTYNVQLPADTETVPTVTATTADENASAAVTQATNLDGTEAERTATVLVTAQDGSTQKTYNIVFSLAPTADLFISEYIEGSSNNKAIEIYNPTGSNVDLSAYSIRISYNDVSFANAGNPHILQLEGSLPSHEVYVIANGQSAAEILAVADTTFIYGEENAHKVPTFNGDDAVGLFKNGTLIDMVGEDAVEAKWAVAGVTDATGEHTLLRKYNTVIGNTDWTASAGTNADDSEWIVEAQNYFDNIGSFTPAPSSDNDILTFSFTEQTEAATINTTEHTVNIEVINGTDLTALVATFTLSEAATAKVGATEQVSGTTANNFTNAVVYTITAEDGSTQNWTVTVTIAEELSSENDITGFTVEGLIGNATIDATEHTITAEVSYNVDLNLKPTFTISSGASIADTTVAKDFTTVQEYTVTAQDGTEQIWTVTITQQETPDMDLFFSEYVEGSSSNKALEIYNPTSETVDLTGYVVKSASNGGDWNNTLALEGTLAAGEVYVIANSGANDEILAIANTTSSVTYFNGDDAVGLFKNDELIDAIGVQGTDPGTAWDVAGVAEATSEHTLLRKTSIIAGNTNWTLSAGTNTDDSEWVVMEQDDISDLGKFGTQTGTDFLTFSLAEQTGAATINVESHTIAIEVLNGTEVNALVATFTLSGGATAKVGATEQVSGTTANDFTNAVVYTITAEDGTTQNWTVTVSVATSQSSENDIISFTVEGIVGNATINTDAHTVSATVEFGKNIESLKPTFEVSPGATITDTTAAKDFSTAQSYTVTAQDGTEQVWVVNIEAESAVEVSTIAELRAGATDGTVYKLTGEATITYLQSYKNQKYIEDNTGAILIFDEDAVITGTYAIGDNITNLVGTIKEYYGTMELIPYADLGAAVSSGNNLTPQVVSIDELTTNAENYESELVKVENVEFVETGNFETGKNYNLSDNSDNTIIMRTNFYDADYAANEDAIPTGAINVTGILGIYSGAPQIYARSSADFETYVGFEAVIDEKQISVFPNPTRGVFYISSENAQRINVSIINIIGKTVMVDQFENQQRNEINISNLPKGIYLIRIEADSETKVVRIVKE